MISQQESQRRLNQARNFYCGDDDRLPRGYWRFGTRRECLSRGVGLGLYVVPDQKEKQEKERLEYKRRKEREDREKNHLRGLGEIYREEEKDINSLHKLDDDLKNKRAYQQFVFMNFDKAKRGATNLESGEIFRNLAVLWKLEQKLERRELQERDLSRKREIRNRSGRRRNRRRNRND